MEMKASPPEGDIWQALSYCSKGVPLDDSLFPRPVTIDFPPDVELLRGNLSDLIHVALNVPHKVTYQSLILAWSPAEEPTRVQLEEVTDDVLRIAFAGLALERFCFCIFLHRTHSVVQGVRIPRIDIHILAASIDLATMRAYKIAPPGWEKRYHPIRDFYNARYGWSSPLDPALARLCQPARVSSQVRAIRRGIEAKKQKDDVAKAEADRHKANMIKFRIPGYEAFSDDKDEHSRNQSAPPIPYKQNILDDLEKQARSGKLTSCQDVLAAIQVYGKVTKVQPTSISVVPHGRDRELKLKGTLFHEDFHPGMIPKPRTIQGVIRAARKKTDKEWDDKRLKLALESWSRMQAQWEYWKHYNQTQRRYRRDGKSNGMDSQCNDAEDQNDEYSITMRGGVLPNDVREQVRFAENRAKKKELLELERQKLADDVKRLAEAHPDEPPLAGQDFHRAQATQYVERAKAMVVKMEAAEPEKELEKPLKKEMPAEVDMNSVDANKKDLTERLIGINAVRERLNGMSKPKDGNAIGSSLFRRT